MKVKQLLENGVDVMLSKPSQVHAAYKALIMRDGPFDVKLDGQSSFIGKHEIAAARTR